jgi:hypothetical protein
MPSSFEADYPAITRWIKEFGGIELGSESFKIDKFGKPEGGQKRYRTVDDALKDLEREITALFQRHGLEAKPLDDRPHRASAKTDKHVDSKQEAETDGSQTLTIPEENGELTPEAARSLIKAVAKLERLANALRRHERLPFIGLTVLKGLCENPQAAQAFAFFLVRRVEQRMREKGSPKRHRELVNRALKEMTAVADRRTKETKMRLKALFLEVQAEQDKAENIPPMPVRTAKSFDLLVVEDALKAILRLSEAPFWLYHAARDYTGKMGDMDPESAPMIEEFASFWRRHFGIKS